MSSNSEYDFRHNWPENERHKWTGVVARVWRNPESNTLRITFSGEWPDAAIVTKDTTVVQRTADGRVMQVDISGLYWD